MEFLEKYWPSLLGVVAVTAAGFAFLGSDDDGRDSSARPVSSEAVDLSRTTALSLQAERDKQGLSDEEKKPLLDVEPPPTDYQYIEVVRAVELPSAEERTVERTLDDPEVKEALSQVRIEMYEADWCGHCRRAREFFEANGLTYTAYDVDSSESVKGKLRRLSGGTSVPVIVIDGKMVRGFSPESVQAVLTEAVKARVES